MRIYIRYTKTENERLINTLAVNPQVSKYFHIKLAWKSYLGLQRAHQTMPNVSTLSHIKKRDVSTKINLVLLYHIICYNPTFPSVLR